ncbi:N-acetylmuramoyl-L-alanine amidase [Chelatococcus sambhunathii]|uniref:N-acetylmuramoyl-L-alanine amidase n=1 Tax=Chelatococcus sambhunathii TaxID=363953 RepID=A0ABU1DI94_9HYPH|nr:N-acetylmuramoyl-L-alanine amidase [Chelatococcus sambhunathii]MDR4307857.1 N-acetylmuramoyl-L-alanine amidase [Chelatococcus sambhunathii]
MSTSMYGFTKRTIAEFEAWIAGVSVARTIRFVQIHHTWVPSYAQFSGGNHFDMQRGMKTYHVSHNGWSDIGQHLSIFPDGAILTGRALNSSPACIYQNNANAICIENVGDFDSGRDAMTADQRTAIIRATAALLKRFGMVARDSTGIVYHHWFDLNTGARTNGSGSTKSCPGTNFFGGNKVANFNANFLPPVLAALAGGAPPIAPAAVGGIIKFAYVDADFLNIRSGPATANPTISANGRVELGSVVRVFQIQNDWYKISSSQQHWIYGRLTHDVTPKTVNTDDTNARSGPGTAFAIVKTFQSGDAVFVHEAQNGWSRVAPDLWIKSTLLS